MDPDYEDKYVLKYGALEQEFEELQAETQEVLSQLQKAKEAKLILQAEIRFLRTRAKMLKEDATSIQGIRQFGSLNEAKGGASQVITPSWGPTGIVLSEGGFNSAFNSARLQSSNQGTVAAQPSKNVDVAGVSKTSCLKHGPNGFPQTKKSGKRKISWQDEFSIKA